MSGLPQLERSFESYRPKIGLRPRTEAASWLCAVFGFMER
jgi:hypothetical protein